MRNLYHLDTAAHVIAETFGAEQGADPWQGGAITPGEFAPVIVRRKDGKRSLTPRLWGVPPPPKGDQAVTNVRNLDSPFWIGTLRHVEFRCLVPVTRYPAAGSQHWLSVPSEPVFAVAGIWRDSEILSFAVVTTEPNALIEGMKQTSMPVILHPEDYETWLSADWNIAQRLVEAFPSQLMMMDGI